MERNTKRSHLLPTPGARLVSDRKIHLYVRHDIAGNILFAILVSFCRCSRKERNGVCIQNRPFGLERLINATNNFKTSVSIPAVRYSTDTKYRYIVNDTHPYADRERNWLHKLMNEKVQSFILFPQLDLLRHQVTRKIIDACTPEKIKNLTCCRTHPHWDKRNFTVAFGAQN
ncbi:unnamed protein product [Nesidiocoris tenuis]|uniref:Uncharacterized protein n=1 Tax=Nesidiocoris tenuis TaxID=355587 RepID=A0A6H5G7Q6_9HEMI|nr:unnamed protein product [Nesidiocoris tenuis]